MQNDLDRCGKTVLHQPHWWFDYITQTWFWCDGKRVLPER